MLEGRVWRFGDNVNTDLMLPGPLLYASDEEQMKAVFAASRPGWVEEVRRGDIMVAGRNFGTGSSRPAARSLRNLGIACLIAESINGLFFRNCVNFGLLAVECPGCGAAFAEGDSAQVDLDGWRLRHAQRGTELALRPVHARLLRLMLEGGVFPSLEKAGLVAPRG